MLPFTTEVFFRLFEHYNAAIWPAQVVADVLGALAVMLTLRPIRGGGRIIAAALAGSWLWIGVVYHIAYFATINWAAWAFGALFVVQGLLFAWTGAVRGRLRFRFGPIPFHWAGLGFVGFAMAAYPLLGWLAGHGWPRAAVFGVAPCPTTIFTLGMLLLAERWAPLHLAVLPVLWSLVGGTAAWLLAVPEDLSLPLAGVSGLSLIVWKNRTSGRPETDD
jgi:hypothetical protein